jgi:hypothetical protein
MKFSSLFSTSSKYILVILNCTFYALREHFGNLSLHKS